MAKWYLANNTTLFFKLKNSEYINKYNREEVNNKDINKDKFNKERVKDKDIKGLGIDIVNKDINKEESKYSNNNFNKLSKVETKDNIKGLSIKIIGIDFNNKNKLFNFKL
jgi:hypothetical protein